MMNDNLSEEVAAADANLLLIEALLDDLWEARQLLERIDVFLRYQSEQPDFERAVTARLLRIQIGAWRDE